MNTDKIIAESIAKEYAPHDSSKIIALIDLLKMYYLNGITAIVSEWLKDDCKKTINEISKIIQVCIFGLNGEITKQPQALSLRLFLLNQFLIYVIANPIKYN